MTKDQFDALVKIAESKGGGWISSANLPLACDVLIDGVLRNKVMRCNRTRGIAEVVAHDPIRTDKYKKRVLPKRVRGFIELVPHGIRR